MTRKVLKRFIRKNPVAGVLLCLVLVVALLFLQSTPSINTDNNVSSQRCYAELIRVIDGDTLLVSIDGKNIKVRLIGIDTPESVHSDESKNNEYGDMASAYTSALLQDISDVWLEYDQEEYDRYGRILAYVWLSSESADDTYQDMLNYELIHDGYAYNKEYAPNTKYADVFEAARIECEAEGRGLWVYEEFAELWQ